MGVSLVEIFRNTDYAGGEGFKRCSPNAVRTVPSMFRFDRMLAYGISQPELEHQED
jgi:hypothetical protein